MEVQSEVLAFLQMLFLLFDLLLAIRSQALASSAVPVQYWFQFYQVHN